MYVGYHWVQWVHKKVKVELNYVGVRVEQSGEGCCRQFAGM